MIRKLAAAALLTLIPVSAQSWKLQYFHDDNESRFTISDFAFPSARRGIAAGYLTYQTANKKPKPYAVVTADGGKTWTGIDLPALPISIFFVDDNVLSHIH